MESTTHPLAHEDSGVRRHEHTSDDPPPEAFPLARGEITILAVVNVVLRNGVLIAAIALSVAATVVVSSVLQPRTYAASVSFMPYEMEAGQDQFSRLTAQLGLSLPGGRSGHSSQFYADLLSSRTILEQAVDARYPISTPTGRVQTTLIDFYVEDETDDPVSTAVRELRERMSITVNSGTGVVQFSVRAPSPELAEAIATRVVDLVNGFNLERRQSRARQEREFVADRLEELRGDLRQSELTLQQFLERNRNFENSPQLAFEHDRLRRQVQMRQQLVTDMATAYEQARIAEVRNTPVITVIDAPDGSGRPYPRRTVWKGLLALVLGAMVGVFLAFARELLRHLRQRYPEDFRETAWLLKSIPRRFGRSF